MAPFMITRSVATARRTVLRASPRSVSSAIQFFTASRRISPSLRWPKAGTMWRRENCL